MTKTFVPYKTSTEELTVFLKAHLFYYSAHVNMKETARAIIHDYFSAAFFSPYPSIDINGSKIFLNQGTQLLLNPNDHSVIGNVINSAFWVWAKYCNVLLTHNGNSTMQQLPTDCYFSTDSTEDVLVYIPSDNLLPPFLRALEVPEYALINCTKGGTAT